MNALLAVVLALPVLVVGRLWHRPALIHAFWILVLLKLVAPPLYMIPIRWEIPESQSIGAATVATFLQSARTADVNRVTAVRTEHVGLQQISVSAPKGLATSARFSQSSGSVIDWQFWLAQGARFMSGVAFPALVIWFSGSMCWFAWQGWRIVRFTQVFLKSARLGPDTLQQTADRLAKRMGLHRAPEVWLLPAVVSPMLWSVGGQSRILFPGELLGRLDDDAIATLLTHELAHYRRGDHHVRLLEFLASGLFWWHPITWLARRELSISEEKCCDAWVVSQFPAAQRQYADALLATVYFLTEKHPPLPILASGLGEVPLLKQRLKLIMCGTAPKSLSAAGRLAVIATAMLIPISPTVRLRPQMAVAAPTRTPQSGPRPVPRPSVPTAEIVAAARVSPTVPPQSPAEESAVAEVAVEQVALAPACAPVPPAEVPVTSPATSESLAPPPAGDYRPSRSRQIFDSLRQILGHSASGSLVTTVEGDAVWDAIICPSSSLVFSEDGNVSLTGGHDGSTHLWNLENLQFVQAPLPALAASEPSVEQDPATRPPVESTPGLAALWSLNERLRVAPATLSPQGLHSVAISTQGITLAVAFNGWQSSPPALATTECDGTIIETTPRVHVRLEPALAIVRFTPAGKLLIVGESGGKLLTWDLGTSVRISR